MVPRPEDVCDSHRGLGHARLGLILLADPARKRGCYPAAQYRRLVVRRGPGKAAVAVGHTLLITAFYLLLRHDTCRDPDPSLLDERLRTRTRQRALAQLQALGYEVTLTEHQATA